MKKFFRKLPVLITFAVVTAVLLALTIGLSARPISIGMTYSGTITTATSTYDVSYKFKNSREAVYKVGETETEMWYIRNGNKFTLLPKTSLVSAEDFDNYVNGIKQNSTTWNNLWENNSFTINAFKITRESFVATNVTNGGAIALTVVLSVLTVVSAAFTTLSILYYTKDKKPSKKAKSKN